MLKWKRTLMNAGVSLSVATVGALAVEGSASAHDAPGSDDGVAHALRGVVSAVGTGNFTITNRQGTETIDTTSTTTFSETGTPLPPVTVAVGQSVAVALDPSDTTPTAVRVTVLLNRVSGKVTNVTGSTITLAGPRAGRQVLISSITQYFNGKTTATGVTDGEFVSAFGTRDATTPGELDAIFVDIASVTPHPPRLPVVNPNGDNDHGDNDHGDNGRGDDHGDRGPLPPAVTPLTTPATTPPAPVGEPGDPDHVGFGDHGDQGDQNDNGGPGPHSGGGNGGEGGGSGGGGGFSGGGGSGSGGHGSGH
jgi:uncharacterized membrane protein YgcG